MFRRPLTLATHARYPEGKSEEDGFYGVARGNAHILHRSKARGLTPLERIVYRHVRRRRDLIAEAPSQTDRATAISLATIARARSNHPGVQSIVIAADQASVEAHTKALEARVGSSHGLSVVKLIPGADARREETQLAKRPDIVVSTPARLIDHIRRGGVDLGGVRTVAVDVQASDTIDQFSADLHFIFAKFVRRPVTIAVVSSLAIEFDLLEDLLRRPVTIPDSTWESPATGLPISPHEERAMSDLPFKPEDLKARIEEIVHAIHHDEDPVQLTKFRKYVRRYTTIFNRGYVLAYLLKQNLDGGQRQPKGSRTRGSSTNESSDRQTIFVSIGRSKRVRSRDLITFFTSADGVTQDDIGQVKVLDNYSFVEVNAAKAKAVVDELNGQELRGRKLTVNFARKK